MITDKEIVDFVEKQLKLYNLTDDESIGRCYAQVTRYLNNKPNLDNPYGYASRVIESTVSAIFAEKYKAMKEGKANEQN